MAAPQMNDQNSSQERLEIFRVLYPLFKHEVFRRREQMMHLSIFHNSLLLLLAVLHVTVRPDISISMTGTGIILLALVLFSSCQGYLMWQLARRHRQAKARVIEMETRMGFYDEGRHEAGTTVYPDHWQTEWQNDRSLTLYLSVLVLMTVLVMSAMLVPA